ncbi:phage tail protein [Orrella dioscoreae]|nr:phage tail protein [Orrella dioscoreae]
MKKPIEVRNMLRQACPAFAADPTKLSVFVDEGTVHCDGRVSLSHEYRYTLTIIVQDYSGDLHNLVVPLLAWLRLSQPEQFENKDLRERMFAIEVELLSESTADVEIKLQLTERAIVTKADDGTLHTDYPGEPPHPELGEADQWP